MRRPALRPLGAALEEVTGRASPATPLARVQACWEAATGPAVATEATPVSEWDGVVTVRCSSAVWAAELELLAGEVIERLRETLGEPSPVRSLRLVVGSSPPD
jgi:predicted nucleic acid-binding Zn ribbon protein